MRLLITLFVIKYFWIIIITILVGLKWYLIMILICIILVTNGVIIFSCASCPFIYILQRNIYDNPLLIVSLLICVFVVELLEFFIFWILEPYQICDLHIFFSHSVGCLFVFFIEFFNATNIFILIKLNLHIFSFVICAFGIAFKKSLLNVRSWRRIRWYLKGFFIFKFSPQFCLYFPKKNHYTKEEIDDIKAESLQS